MNRFEGGLRIRGQFARKPAPGRPLVTVVTVVYNGVQHLEHTIQGVLGQTYDNIEYIIIDGGSTDGTLNIIRRYENKIDYWVSECDKGLYDAMNKGIALSSGDWINFMNAGDSFYQTDTVQRVMSSDCGTADLIYGHCQMIYDPDFSLIWKAKKITDLWKGMIFRHQSLFARASVCKDLYFSLEYKIGADFAFIFSCYQRKFTFSNIDLVVSSVTAGGLSDTNIILALKETRRAVVQYHNTLKVNAYYRWMIFFTYLKRAVKKILPSKIRNRARSLKYR
jgi:glycosyltransferase involved in cell wall biosynthesis